MIEFWNERYSEREFVYGKTPNHFFKSRLDLLTPGKILMSAEGEGRNAVYAAEKGWDVYAFDTSEAGKAKADALALERGVKIHYEAVPWEETGFKNEKFDAIGIIYNHFPPTICEGYFSAWVGQLKPGGRVIMEVFSKAQIEYQAKYQSGGPNNPEMLYDLERVRNLFPELHFSILEELEVELREGAYHEGLASVVRMEGSTQSP